MALKRIIDLPAGSALSGTESVPISQGGVTVKVPASAFTVSGTGDLAYTFDQATASATWNIAHNLGKYPSVTVTDSSGNVVVGDVNHTDANNLTVSFRAAFAGHAYMN